MKKHGDRCPDHDDYRSHLGELTQAMSVLDGQAEIESFLTDLCTPAELEALVDRWRVVGLLREGLAYREINARTGVSVTTIGRVARFLEQGAGGYQRAFERLNQTREQDQS